MSTEMNSATSISSAGECLANRPVLPGSEKASWMTAGSGLKLFASLETYGPIGACLRTFVGSLLLSREWSSTICFLNWKATATKSRRRSLFQLAPSTPRTAEIGCEFKNQRSLPNEVKLWPTPTVQDSENDGGPSQFNRNTVPLNAVVRLYPTPRSCDGEKGCRTPEEAAKERLRRKNGEDLPSVVMGMTYAEMPRYVRDAGGLPLRPSGSLNPEWVEWLMGFPIGYIDCGPWVTPSSRKSSKKSAAR